MKRFLTSILALIIAAQAFCAPVDQTKAAAKAKAFFQTSSSSAVMAVPALAKASSAQNPTWFAFNNPKGGFVIISGDDAAPEILAYSREGSFDANNLPENLGWWLGNIDSQIRDLRNAKAAPLANQLHAGTPVKEYTTAKWGQGDPFNKNCPVIAQDKPKTLVGSAATAAAIVCRYNEWPAKGNGSTPYYTYSSTETGQIKDVQENTLGTYDYAEMPLEYDDNWTDSQKNTVAKFSYDLATAAKTAFGNLSSDAPIEMMLSGLVTYMSYKKSAVPSYRASYPDAGWLVMLKNNIETVGPFIYYAEDEAGDGHAFVIDGYDDQDYFSINWGWSGEYNGYYLLSNLNPGDAKYSKNQAALLNLIKDESGESEYVDKLILFTDEGYKGLEASTTSFEAGKPFTVKMGAIRNVGTQPFNGTVYLTLYNAYNVKKEDVATVEVINGLPNYFESGKSASKKYASISCSVSENAALGDYIQARFQGQYSSDVIVNGDEGCIYQLFNQISKEALAAGTSISYSKPSMTFTFHCTYDTTVNICDKEGKVAATSSAAAGDDCEVNISALAAGEYSMNVVCGTTVYSITFNL